MIVGSIASAVAVMTRAMRGNHPVEGAKVGHEEYYSEDPPHLSDLERVVRIARNLKKSCRGRSGKEFQYVNEFITKA